MEMISFFQFCSLYYSYVCIHVLKEDRSLVGAIKYEESWNDCKLFCGDGYGIWSYGGMLHGREKMYYNTFKSAEETYSSKLTNRKKMCVKHWGYQEKPMCSCKIIIKITGVTKVYFLPEYLWTRIENILNLIIF